MRMTTKVEVQAISWPTIWLPERQITPAFTCAAKPVPSAAAGGVEGAGSPRPAAASPMGVSALSCACASIEGDA
jgi:hypothetical protein